MKRHFLQALLFSALLTLLPLIPVLLLHPEEETAPEEEPVSVSYDAKAREYVVEGPRVEKMLGYTNLETEKGFVFFQKFLAENGITDRLKELGCREGDTVRLYGHYFDFYD